MLLVSTIVVPPDCCTPAAVYQVRIVEAAKEKLQKDMRSGSSRNLAAMVTVQA